MTYVFNKQEVSIEEAKELLLKGQIPDEVDNRRLGSFDIASYTFRSDFYTKNFGFALLTKKVLREISDVFEKYNLISFVEIYAGTGYLSRLLNEKIGCVGTGYTLDLNPVVNYGFDKNSAMISDNLNKNYLAFKAFEDLSPSELNVDVLIASWIPYDCNQGQSFKKMQDLLPKHFLLIGEGYGGCTADDEFFDWLDEVYEEEYVFKSYIPFDGIYDDIILYKKKV